MLYRLGLALARHARLTLALSALAVIAFIAIGSQAFSQLSSGGFADPKAESSRAAAAITEHFGASPNLIMVVTADDGDITGPAAMTAGRELTSALATEQDVSIAASYFTTPTPTLLSENHDSAMVLAVIAGDQGHMVDRGGELIADYSGPRDDVTVRFGGAAGVYGDINSQVATSLIRAESIAVPLTLVLLLIVFGSFVSAVLPLLIGGIAIAGTFAELAILGSLTDVSVFSINLTTALGLGLGIDYGLLMVARFREQLESGDDVPHAVARTVATAGRTILFSAAAVGCALATLLLFPLFFLSSFGYAGIGVVVVAALGALLVTPAALALLGPRVNAGRMPWNGTATGSASPFWHKLATTVFRRPVLTAVPVLALLVIVASPLLGIRFALPDVQTLPTSAQSRQVADVIESEFPARAHATIPAILDGPAHADTAVAYALALSEIPHVATVSGPGITAVHGRALPPNPLAGTMSADGWQRLTVVTDVPDGSDEARAVVSKMRSAELPGGPGILVSGTDASLADTMTALAGPLPWVFGIIVATTFVLLFLFTGSVLQPIRALVVNGLSLAAAVGIVTWIFQDGHLIEIFGATPQPLEASMTILLLCIVFGLSMDYEVFLSSRITEMHYSGHDLETSVTDGLAHIGKIVTSAAVLLAVTLLAFATSTVSMLQFFGLGAGLAILIDATLIRGVLVPAAMRMLGRANFWAPRSLKTLYRAVGLSDGEAVTAAPGSSAGSGSSAAARRSRSRHRDRENAVTVANLAERLRH